MTLREIVSPVFAAEDREHFRALRKSDPQANLEARWEKIAAARPDLALGRLGYVPKIIENGWAVVGIPEDGFAYTIGLNYRYGQPELLIAAPHLSSAEIQQLLNAIGTYVALRRAARRPLIRAGEPVDLQDFGLSVTFRPYSGRVFEEKYATGYLATFEQMFEDRDHDTGDTLPVLWAELSPSAKPTRRGAKGARKKRAAKTASSKRPARKTGGKTGAKKSAKKRSKAKAANAKKRSRR